jgi:hypothetical protein
MKPLQIPTSSRWGIPTLSPHATIEGTEKLNLFPIDAEYAAPCSTSTGPFLIHTYMLTGRTPKAKNHPYATPVHAIPNPWYLNLSVSQPGSPFLFFLRFPLLFELLQFRLR